MRNLSNSENLLRFCNPPPPSFVSSSAGLPLDRVPHWVWAGIKLRARAVGGPRWRAVCCAALLWQAALRCIPESLAMRRPSHNLDLCDAHPRTRDLGVPAYCRHSMHACWVNARIDWGIAVVDLFRCLCTCTLKILEPVPVLVCEASRHCTLRRVDLLLACNIETFVVYTVVPGKACFQCPQKHQPAGRSWVYGSQHDVI